MLAIGVIANTLLSSGTRIVQQNPHLHKSFDSMKISPPIIIMIFSSIGTIIILFAVRRIVKPIKELSNASKQVAKGNFDVHIENDSDDELGQLANDFNAMAKELKSIDKMRTEFVSNVSHEFRTPITSIKGFASLINDGKLSEQEIAEYSAIIVSESERLMNLSGNLLKISELDSQAIRAEGEEYFLDEQIRKIVVILEPIWSKKGVKFDINLDQVKYKCNHDLLQQVWLNILQNAIKFTPEDGEITVNLFNDGEAIRTEIKNTGEGISDVDILKIFEPFYKTDVSHHSEGNGLGLTIVKKIVDILGGEISVSNSPQTSFEIILPNK